MDSYCVSGDLLVGDIPIPAYLNKEKVVTDAADEMDSIIGFRYVTPIVFVPETAENRPSRLLLKRINAHLATGRLLMEAAIASESTELHAYAKRMVDESLSALCAIRDGETILVDAPTLPGNVGEQTGPLQYNKDAESMVDKFYDEVVFASPTYIGPY